MYCIKFLYFHFAAKANKDLSIYLSISLSLSMCEEDVYTKRTALARRRSARGAPRQLAQQTHRGRVSLVVPPSTRVLTHAHVGRQPRTTKQRCRNAAAAAEFVTSTQGRGYTPDPRYNNIYQRYQLLACCPCDVVPSPSLVCSARAFRHLTRRQVV